MLQLRRLLSGVLILAPLLLAVGPVSGQPPVKPAADEKRPEEPIDFTKAKSLFDKRQRGGKLTADEEALVRRALAAIQARQGNNAADQRRSAPGPVDSIGLKPLTEMSAKDRYFDQDGGLYGSGLNEPPAAHRRAAETQLAKIEPLNAQGQPAKDGRIGFVSISMSNATQEFSRFKQVADRDASKSASVTIVDCAQGGQAMAEWVPPEGRPWTQAMERIASAKLAAEQVQVAWIKLANKGPRGSLEEHGRKLTSDTEAVVRNAKQRFPNLRIAYLSSRIYGGFGTSGLNPEPYAYESAFATRWLIQNQIQGKVELAFDASNGSAKSPLLLWGPYLWADGKNARQSDQLVWTREDLAGDGTHPSEAGRDKVAAVMLKFFSTDPLAKSWFTGKRDSRQ